MTKEHTYLEKYTSHTLFSKGLRKGCERVDVDYVWEVSWRQNRLQHIDPNFLKPLLHFFLILLGCSTGVLRAQALCPALALTTASCFQLRVELELWLQLELNPACRELQLTQVVCGTWLYNCLTSTCFMWAYVSAPNSTTSKGQGAIFDRMHLFLPHRCIS